METERSALEEVNGQRSLVIGGRTRSFNAAGFLVCAMRYQLLVLSSCH